MLSLFSARGCVYAFNQGSGQTRGFYALNPQLAGESTSPVLILGISVNDEDIVLPKPTLDKFKILYSFGQGFGQVQIQGLALLGPSGGGGGSAVAKVTEYFQAHRTSSSAEPIGVSLPGRVAYRVYLTALAVGQTDAQFHTQQFLIGGLLAGTPNTK